MFAIFRQIKFFENSKSFQQVFNYSKYAKKVKDCNLEKEQFDLVYKCITSRLKNRKSLSVSEFKRVGVELNSKCKDFKHNGFDHVFNVLLTLRPHDSLANAKNFADALNIHCGLRLKHIFIRFYVKKSSECKLTEKEEQELIGLCNEFIARELHMTPAYNFDILEGLCATKEWRKAIEWPHSSDIVLNILAKKALRANEIDLTWNILDRLAKLPQDPHLDSETIEEFAKYFAKNPACIPKNAEKLFSLCERFQMIFMEPSVKELTVALEKHGHQAKVANINLSGICEVCKNQLEPVRITDSELDTLKTEFIKNVVNEANIHEKTTSEEWESFKQILIDNGPFDVVIDGLNICYNSDPNNDNPSPSAASLLNIVKQLNDEGKRILVIGKKHMTYWEKMRYMRQIVTVFLVDNKSHDDIFLLYAGIHGGRSAQILTNDRMQDHRDAIGDKCYELFKLWQQEHWYRIKLGRNNQIELVKPMPYKMHIHKNADCWHIPFISRESLEFNVWDSYRLPENWACIRIKKSVETN